ncbi:TPA: cytochrome c biogenesis protein CcsA [Vibrio cholerae]|nr:cytochrome c biogenesis protein CcsA [Vibrio cholerae]
MDNLIAIAAAMLYLLSIATIVPGLVNQTGIRAKTVFISAAIALLFHGWLLSDLILHSSGQNLSILNVASLISFIISLALFSYSTLSIGALYALQLAWLDHKLKSKKVFSINPNLPPLLLVERQLFKIILIGNLLLTGTLLTGFIFVQDMFAQGKAHKGILSFVAWIVYSILLWGHYRKGWRGKKVTWFAVAGATLLTLAYFGSRFVREIILR